VLLEHPLVAAAVTRDELSAPDSADDRLFEQFRRAFHPKRSGEVLFAWQPYYIAGKSYATHGSPWQYDSHVPLLCYGHGIHAAHCLRRVTPAAIAPTVARLLQVSAPGGCEVEPLVEALGVKHND
jgi:hypothetical protein